MAPASNAHALFLSLDRDQQTSADSTYTWNSSTTTCVTLATLFTIKYGTFMLHLTWIDMQESVTLVTLCFIVHCQKIRPRRTLDLA